MYVRALPIFLISLPIYLSACTTEIPVEDPEADLSGAPVFRDGSTAELELARTLASRHLAPLVEARGLAGLHELVPTRLEIDELGMADLKVQQHHQGVPVFGAEALVHLDETGALHSLTDHLLADLDVDTTPAVDEADAVERAVGDAGGWGVLTDDVSADLWVVRHEGQDRLAWRVSMRRMDGTADTDLPVIFVDAHTGERFWRLTNMKTADGTGTSNYSGTVALKIYKPAGDTSYYLEHPGQSYSTFSFAGGESSAYYVSDTDTAFTSSAQREAVDAHYYAGVVKDYYDDIHSWNAVDGSDGPGTVPSLKGDYDTLALYVNYGTDYANAFWTGAEMVFGDGDGYYFGPLTTLDITGHEMTHGVTASLANFTYYGEPGAIDEGYADIFGAMTERHLDGDVSAVWKIGEDAYTPGTSGDALRYMNDPNKDGYTTSHYDDLYCDPADYCGVHANAGIIMLAYYLLSEGGKHPDYGGTTMTGVGEDTAELIAFRALKKYSGASTDFEDARNGWLDAATDLYTAGSSEYKAVMNAWAHVGVGVSANTSTCTGYDYPFSGVLTGAGNYKYYVKSSGGSYSSGTFTAKLTGDSGTDFDVFLQKKGSDGKFATVAKSKTSGTSTESLSYSGTSGTYRIQVKSTSGSGDFTACLGVP